MKKSSNQFKEPLILHVIAIILSIIFLIPFLMVISASFSREIDITLHGFRLIPLQVDLTAYRYVFNNPQLIFNAYRVTIIVTVIGTALSVLMMSMCSYVISRKNFKFKKILSFYIFFTMLFSGGLAPSYILITQYLNMRNTIWVLFVPGLVNAFHIIMLRTFFQKTPDSLYESAKIDGASEYRILFSIAYPLSIPALATIGFLGAMARWNDWFTALLYIGKDELLPLQYLLYRIQTNIQFLLSAMEHAPNLDIDIRQIPGQNLRMAMVVVTSGPMLVVFPFFQKYFVRGLTVGSVKG